MSEKEIFDKLINIFNIVINRSVDVSKINIDSKIVEDLGVNSIGLIYLAVAVEEEFDVVYVYEISPITMAIPAIKYGKKNNTPVFLYCCDILP